MLDNINPHNLRITSQPTVYSGHDNITLLSIETLIDRRYVPFDATSVTRWVLMFPNLQPTAIIDSDVNQVFIASVGSLVIDLSNFAINESVQNCWLIAYDQTHPNGVVMVDNKDCVVSFSFREVSGVGYTPLPTVNYITDAPVDGKTYARLNGLWNDISAEIGVSSVNSKVGSVTLTYSDVGAISILDKGVASGVAELDQNGLVPVSQLPSLGAQLGNSQPQSLGVASAGTASVASREDHVHPIPSASAIGLGNVDNTSDLNKPVSIAQQTALNAKIDSSSIGVPNGVASLDSAGLVPLIQIPAAAITNTSVVNDQASMLALVAQVGDVAIRPDIPASFILQADPPSVLSNWQQILTPAIGGGASVGNATPQPLGIATSGVSSNASREDHVHQLPTKADIGLSNVDNTSDVNKPISTATQTALNTKQATLVSGTNIKTINGNSILGGGDITITSGGGSSGYTVQYVTGATAGQLFSFNLPYSQTSYGYGAYALKEETGSSNQTVTYDTFDSTSSLKYYQTSALVWNGTLSPYVGGSYTTTIDGSFYSSSIKADGQKINLASSTSTTVVPIMTSNTTPSGYVASASSVDGSYYPYKAFDGIIGDSVWACPGVGWLRIDLPSITNITSYSITNRGSGTVFNAISWTFEGSNDGSSWTVLHTVSGDNNTAYAAERKYNLTQVASYKSYRVNVSSSNGGYTVIAEMKLFAGGEKILIQAANGSWYSSQSGTLTQVAAPVAASDFDSNGFQLSGDILASSLSGLIPIKVFTKVSTQISSVYTPYSQIAIQSSIAKVASYSVINSMTLTATQTGSGKVRIAVSRDLTNWMAWNGTTWVSIGSLQNNQSSANNLVSSGMTPTTFNAITSAQWSSFYSSNSGIPDTFAIAFALDVQNPSSDYANIDLLNLNVNFISAQKLQTPAEVEIRWYKDQVTFKTINTGNYRLAYQAPTS